MAREMDDYSESYRAVVRFEQDAGKYKDTKTMIFGPYKNKGTAQSQVNTYKNRSGNLPHWFTSGDWEYLEGWVEESKGWTRLGAKPTGDVGEISRLAAEELSMFRDNSDPRYWDGINEAVRLFEDGYFDDTLREYGLLVS